MADVPELPKLLTSIKTWDDGVQAVRGSASWFVTALGVIAVALFGATAIVVRPELSWDTDRDRLLLAGLLAAIGVGCSVAIAYAAAKTAMPVIASLDDLPQTVRDELRKHPDSYLPIGTTVDTFLGDATAAREIAQLRRDELSGALAPLAGNPDDAHLKAAAESAKMEVAGAEVRQQEHEAGLQRVLDRVRFERVKERAQPPRWVPWIGAFAAVCGIWYQLVLTTPKEATDDGAAATSATQAVLVRDQTDPDNNALWKNLHLEGCEPASLGTTDPNGILVIVSGGKGTPENPYTVTTMPETAKSKECQSITFATIDSVARVVKPKPVKVEITYTPATPTATPR